MSVKITNIVLDDSTSITIRCSQYADGSLYFRPTQDEKITHPWMRETKRINKLKMKEAIIAQYKKYEKQKNEIEKIKNPFFEEDILRWLRTIKKPTLKISTYDRMEQVIRNQILPNMPKGIKTRDITTQIIQDLINGLYDECSGKPVYSYSIVNKVYTHLADYFQRKIIEKVIDDNPMANGLVIKPTKENVEIALKKYAESHGEEYEEKKVLFLENEELDKIKNVIYNGYALEPDKYHPYNSLSYIPQCEFFIFMLQTGIRAGEAAALKYENVDLEAKTLKIEKTRTTYAKRDENGNIIKVEKITKKGKNKGKKRMVGEYETDDRTPKTKASRATIRINQKAVDIIKEMKANDDCPCKEGYILHDSKGNPITTDALKKRWKKLCKYAGIKPYGIHALRHTAASHMLAQTNNIKLVSQLLRHTSVTFTEEIYADIIKETVEEFMMKFEV